MRWHVHGNDAFTGEPVLLGVDDADATGAVHAAFAHRILVSRVVPGGLLGYLNSESPRRALLSLLAASLIVLLPLAGAVLCARQGALHHFFSAGQDERAKLAASLREAQFMLGASQSQRLEAQAAGDARARQLSADLQSARELFAQTQAQFALARDSLGDLERAAAAVPVLQTDLDTHRKKLAEAQSRIHALDAQLADQRSRLAALDEARKKAAAAAESRAATLASQNRTFAAQIDLLKSQLLELAARPSSAPAATADAASDALASPRRPWGLRTGYDAASDFAALNFGKDSLHGSATEGDTLSLTALNPANACTLVLQTDRRRVYSATLKVSFAAGAPQKIVQNSQLLSAFAQTFAPGWKTADADLAAAMKSLADKDASQRLILLGDDYKATLWNNKFGLYALRIESPRDTLDED